MSRAIILVLDSLGIGAAADAEKFGDVGANTLGHIADWCMQNNGYEGRNKGALRIPNMTKLGLAKANQLGSGTFSAGLDAESPIIGLYGACNEISTGKDTPSGHWEITGVPVRFDWGYFPVQLPCFTESLISALKAKANLDGILGNCHASGTEILERLGEQHILTGYPICYTSADSVFQIAAHEKSFGLERLYQVCEVARELVNELQIGRVIARPFDGSPSKFNRTGNRKDYTTPPHADTLLDKLIEAGREVHSIGKIADIFAHRGFTHKIKATGHDALFNATLESLKIAKQGSLIFTNFVEFDQSFGHRRNPGGYAAALEHFDQRLPEIIDAMKQDDLLILTADHGCDPTFPGNDHTREHVPFVAFSKSMNSETNVGVRESFCDIGQSIATHLQIAPLEEGVSVF